MFFGSEDLYLVPRLQAAAEAARHPERYTEGLAAQLSDFSTEPDANEACLALANATGRHWLILSLILFSAPQHLGAADGDCAWHCQGTFLCTLLAPVSRSAARGAAARARAFLSDERRRK